MKVGNIVQKNFKTIDQNATVFDAVKMMNENGLYGLLVTNGDNHYVGIISERSIINRFVLRNVPASEVLVKSVMRTPLPRVMGDDDVKDVASFLANSGLSRCAVFDRNDKLLGIITITDLSRHLSVQSVSEVLLSHRSRKFKFRCPVCMLGTMEPVYNAKGEITVFKCNNESCGHME